MADRHHRDGQEQALDQRYDHLQCQVEFGSAGRTDHRQANHHEGGDQRVAATHAIAEHQKQAQADQHNAGHRVVMQQRYQQQAAAGGHHQHHGQAQAGLERQWPIHRRQHRQRQHRCDERDRQGQAEARGQAQRSASGQAQGSPGTDLLLSRHTTSSSSRAGTAGRAGSAGCLRWGTP
ncbi:hypothetical protein D3C81_1185230 [compost metagenome]